MTPKEKAEELVLRYLRLQEKGSSNWLHKTLAKQCALIAVDEIIENIDFELCDMNGDFYINPKVKYWKEVKREIEKL